MRVKLSLVVMTVILLATVSCNKVDNLKNVVDDDNTVVSSRLLTKAYGDKTPKLVGYVETNDVNPLNAGDYCLSDTTACFDVVELFAANINDDGNGDPCIYFNGHLAPIMASPATYIQPLQAKGIKVLLTILPNWADIGLCTMTSAQAYDFAEILAYVVNTYGLDGIGFDDEYEGNNYTQVSNSYGNIIYYLHSMLSSDKLITVFDYKHTGTSQIFPNAAACIDYAYTDFSYWNTSSHITGMTKARWAPMSLQLGYSYSSIYLSYVNYYASLAASQNYGAIMTFNLRSRCEVDPLPVLQEIADGAWSETVIMDPNVPSGITAGCRPLPAETSGVTITHDDI